MVLINRVVCSNFDFSLYVLRSKIAIFHTALVNQNFATQFNVRKPERRVQHVVISFTISRQQVKCDKQINRQRATLAYTNICNSIARYNCAGSLRVQQLCIMQTEIISAWCITDRSVAITLPNYCCTSDQFFIAVTFQTEASANECRQSQHVKLKHNTVPDVGRRVLIAVAQWVTFQVQVLK